MTYVFIRRYKCLIVSVFIHLILLTIFSLIFIVTPHITKACFKVTIQSKPEPRSQTKAPSKVTKQKEVVKLPVRIIKMPPQIKKRIMIKKPMKSPVLALPRLSLAPKKIKVKPPIGYRRIVSGESLQGQRNISFFGSEARGSLGMGIKSVVFVVDRSGSMMGERIAEAKAELTRSISMLKQRFTVIFYSDDFVEFKPEKSLVKASRENKQACYSFINSIEATGGTSPLKAMERALSYHPDLIYLLTDGEFGYYPGEKPVAEEIAVLNKGKHTKINTIAFKSIEGENVLRKIAEQNRGEFNYVK